MAENKGKCYSRETRDMVRNLRLIDDDLFKVVGEDVPTSQEMLRALLNDENIVVLQVFTQVQMVGLKREIRLDMKCILGNGNICNMEVQKSNINDDIRRTRFHNSILTVNNTEKGMEFKDIPDVISIYISEYDVLGNGQRITPVRRCQKLGDRYVPVDDGELIIFANTIFTDEELGNRASMSDADRLLTLFIRRDIFYDEKFPHTSNRVKYFKENEEGVDTMCKAVEEYGDRRAKIAEARGKKEALQKTARNMKVENAPTEFIMKVTGLSREEIENL